MTDFASSGDKIRAREWVTSVPSGFVWISNIGLDNFMTPLDACESMVAWVAAKFPWLLRVRSDNKASVRLQAPVIYEHLERFSNSLRRLLCKSSFYQAENKNNSH